MTIEIGLMATAGVLGAFALLLVFVNKRLGQQADSKGGQMQRVHADDADDDTLGDEDDDDDDDEDEDEDEDDGDGDGDGADGEGEGTPTGGDSAADGGAAKSGDEPLTMKAFVALSDQVHSIVLPLDKVESWGQLSQTIHEVCEDGDVPDLPEHGIMHIVLNVNGTTVPVTGRTPIDELWRAKAIKVSITAEEEEEEEEEGEEGEEGEDEDENDEDDEEASRKQRPLRSAS
jgi:hypothetical protein